MSRKMLDKIKLAKIIGKNNFFLLLVLFFGFLIRIYFVDKYINVSGDLLLYADWGQKFWEYGSKNFYFVKDWYYSPPNYPPIISLIYAFSYWLYDHKYVLAQLHNIVRLYPSEFIEYFYKYGYYLLLKLPAIIADLGLGILIYKTVLFLTKSFNKALLGLAIYVFNPVSILLSAIWGQTDSLIAFFALLSFLLLLKKRFIFSMVFCFISLFIKPNWIYLFPLYLYFLIRFKPKFRDYVIGGALVFVIFYLTSSFFTSNGVIGFSNWLISERLIRTATIAQKASVSAFNFYTLFFKFDSTSDKIPILGIPANVFSMGIYLLLNVALVFNFKKRKVHEFDLLYSVFILGFGIYLFMTNMLERYFFPAFVPLIILAMYKFKIFKYFFLINLAVFANLFFSFFRRKYGAVADAFYANDYLLIRIFSLANLFSWLLILVRIKIVKDTKNPIANS